jgi:hypothetical protein
MHLTETQYAVPFRPSSMEITMGELTDQLTNVPGFVGLKCAYWPERIGVGTSFEAMIQKGGIFAVFESRNRCN